MNRLSIAGATQALGPAGLTAAGGETVYDVVTAFNFTIGGQMYTKATAADQATPTTDANTLAAFTALAGGEKCAYLWCVNAAGAVSVAQGPIVPSGDVSLPQLPGVPAATCPFAYSVSEVSAGNAHTFGTSNWNATGHTDLVVNIGTLPERPPNVVTA